MSLSRGCLPPQSRQPSGTARTPPPLVALSPALCLCGRQGWAGVAQPHQGPTGASPAAELCAGSRRGQPGVEASGSLPREFLVPADGHPSWGRGPGGTGWRGSFPDHVQRPGPPPVRPSARLPPPGKDRTAPGKGWEDPELQAGEWKLVAAPLASRGGPSPGLASKRAQANHLAPVCVEGLCLPLPSPSWARGPQPLGTRTKSSWNWEEATIPSILRWPQGSGGDSG